MKIFTISVIQFNQKLANVAFGALPLFLVGILQVLQGETILELKETHMHMDTEGILLYTKNYCRHGFLLKFVLRIHEFPNEP